MATGVLPILLKSGTKCSQYIMEHDKVYDATLKLGIKTNTGDITGEIIEEEKVLEYLLTDENINKIFTEFIGKQTQIPPMYSAVKVNGKKLYEYEREGIEVERPVRNIEIYSMQLIDVDKEKKTIRSRVHCSIGT